MDAVIEPPVTYCPKMDVNTKEYTDQPVYDYTKGVICPCTPSKVFQKRDSFHTHWKCMRHKKWIVYLNENAQNFYKESLDQKRTLRMQQTMLIDLETQLKQKDVIIKYLEDALRETRTSHLHLLEDSPPDLLNFSDTVD